MFALPIPSYPNYSFTNDQSFVSFDNISENLKLIFESAANILGVDAHLLRDQQGEVVVSVLEGEDTFCILPTGFGKSLVHQSSSMSRFHHRCIN